MWFEENIMAIMVIISYLIITQFSVAGENWQIILINSEF